MRYTIALKPAIALLVLTAATTTAQAQTSSGAFGQPDLGGYSLGRSPNQPGQLQSLDKIVAIVNSDVILKSELDQAVAKIKQRNRSRMSQIRPNVLRSQVLDQLIMRQLQIQRANEDGIKVSKKALRQGLARIAQRNNMNLEQFTQAVAQSGMRISDLRNRVSDEIKISQVRQEEVMGKVAVSDQDVDRYLQNQSLRFSRGHQYHLRQIELNLPANAQSTTVGVTRDRLKDLRRRIISGQTSFAAIARSVSDAQNAAGSGDLGWISGDHLPDSFDSALAGLKTGQISPVFRGANGLYLLKLEGERGGGGQAGDPNQKVMITEAHIRHLVLKPNQIRSDAQTRERIQRIRQRLLAGDDFAALAREYSDDKGTANQGGDVGWLPLNRLAPDTRRHIDNLQKGQISRIFQTSDGYEIIKLLGKRRRDETQEARRHKARQTLGRKRAGEKGQLWLRKLRDQAYVDIRMPNYHPTPGTPGS